MSEARIHVFKRKQRSNYLQFNGSTQYLFTPANQTSLSITGDITISAWIKLDVGSKAQTIVAKQNSEYTTSCTYELSITNGVNPQFQFIQYAGGVLRTTVSLSSIPIGQWCHIAVTRQSSNLSMFLNGVPDKTATYSGVSSSTTTELKVGRRENATNYLQGSVSEIRIFDRALNLSEINLTKNYTLLNSERTGLIIEPTVNNLQYYLPIDEGNVVGAFVLRDYSNNGIHTSTGFMNLSDWQFVNLPPLFYKEYKGQTSRFSTSSITRNINNGSSSLVFTTPNSKDNANTDLFLDDEALEFNLDYYSEGVTKTIFRGISRIRDYSLINRSKVTVEAYSVISELTNYTPRSYTGAYNIAFAGSTLENAFKYTINTYNLQNPLLPLSYSDSTIDTTGVTIDHEFYNCKDYLTAFRELWDYAPFGWYWYIDETNTFYLKNILSNSNYIFVYGKDIIRGREKSDSTKVINRIRISNGDTIHRAYKTENSIVRFGQYQEVFKDENIRTAASMDLIANKRLTYFSTPNEQIQAIVLDKSIGGQYDIVDIKPGQTFSIVNTESVIANKTISAVTLHPNKAYAEITASDTVEYISRELNSLKQQQFKANFDSSSPNAYVEVI